MFASLSETLIRLAVLITAEFQGLSVFLFCCLNLKARLVCAQTLKKSSGISKIIFKKFSHQGKSPEIRHFLLKNFFLFLFIIAKNDSDLGLFMIRICVRIGIFRAKNGMKSLILP